MRSRFGYRTAVPSISSRKAQTKQLSFTGGVDSYSDNDDVKPNKLVAATDARMVKIGRYKTRRGLDRYSVPVGEAVQASVSATTGAGTVTADATHSYAQKLTTAASGRFTKAELRVRTTASSKGTLLVQLYSDAAGAPGSLLAASSIPAFRVTSSYAYVPAYFVEAPLLTSGQVVWLVVAPQSSTTGSYELSTTTASALALARIGTGSWTTTGYSLNSTLYLSTDGGVKGVYRAYRPNGLKVTLFAAGDSMYTVNDITGAVTAIKTGMNAAATRYRFEMVQDAVYWVNGYEKPYKYDLATATVSQVTAAPEIAGLLIEHKGLVFYGNAVDRTQDYFTKFGVYDAFVSTDFLTVMAPKSPHSHTAFAKLNGALYIFAKRNKYVVLGDNNATWSIDEAADQRGTFSQESVVYDANFIYHADEEGVHQFNGTESRNLAKNFLPEYLAIPDKSTVQLELYNNRLYIFYTPAGQALNTECYVYNLLLDVVESRDTGAHVGRTFARYALDDIFIQASNKVPALYYGELDSNNYDNLGSQLSFELDTAYGHFDAPGQSKRITKWRPVFSSASASYSIQCGYAVDSQVDAVWQDVSLSGQAPRFDTGLLFDTGVRFGSSASIEPTTLIVPGNFKRLQRRYKHVAANEPVEMDSEILSIEVQRLI